MPGKSRRGRGKYSPPSRKRKGKLNRPTILVRQPAITQTHESVPSLNVSLPAAKVSTTMEKPAASQYPYIATELLTIGILASVMLIVLVVLALVLS